MSDSVDIWVGIITSDFQVRVRGGRWMGFDNASWDRANWRDLMLPNMRVDVDHKRGKTISGFLLTMEAFSTPDFQRTQADWREPRPMDYVLATFALPLGPAMDSANKQMRDTGRVGISIEHGGRKPRRTIGPCVTITSRPWNRDCWMIYRQSSVVSLYPHDKTVAPSILENARRMVDSSEIVDQLRRRILPSPPPRA